LRPQRFLHPLLTLLAPSLAACAPFLSPLAPRLSPQVNKQLGVFHEALQAFEKLHTLAPAAPEVMFQIANLHEVGASTTPSLTTRAAHFVTCAGCHLFRDFGPLSSLPVLWLTARPVSCPHLSRVCLPLRSAHSFPQALGSFKLAAKYFNLLLARVPSDPGVLNRLGAIFAKDEDETQAFHYHAESYRYYPVNLEVISWLGVWYVT